MPQRSCARLHHQSAIRGERLAKEWLRCHGLDASVEWWARRQRCSLRCGGLGVRTQPLLLPRADRPAAALVPSTSHGAARIMIELRNSFAAFGWFTDLPDYLFGASRSARSAASRSASTFSAASRFACTEASFFAILAASRFASLAASRSTLRAASRSAFSAASRCARSAASIFAFSAASRFACLARSEEHTSELQSLRHLVCR